MSKVKIGLCQIPEVGSKEGDLKIAAEYVKRAVDQGAQIVSLPEMFCCTYANEYFWPAAEEKGGYIWSALRDIAIENKVYFIGGSMPEVEDGKLYNTSFVFDPDGNQIARHRKMHMFDIDVKGGQFFKESDTFTPGNDVTVFDTPYGKVGVEICFDIRFFEQTRLMALQGADIVISPGEFNMSTGPVHWELLFRARALDNQIFVCGCAAARNVNGPYVSWGNSLIVDPWGTVVAKLDGEAGIIVQEIDTDMITNVRNQIPVMSARRTDLYDVVLK